MALPMGALGKKPGPGNPATKVFLTAASVDYFSSWDNALGYCSTATVVYTYPATV